MNPVDDLIVKLVETHHQTSRAVLHVSQSLDQMIQLFQSLSALQPPATQEVAATKEGKTKELLKELEQQLEKINSNLPSFNPKQSSQKPSAENINDSLEKYKGTQNDAIKLWEATVKILKDHLTVSEYELWFSPLSPVSVEEDKLFLRSGNEIVAKHVRERYASKIEDALAEVSHTVRKVKILNPIK